jgi:hypothetical protein
MKAQRWIQLETAFNRTEVIVVCWHPDCSMHHLKDWSEDDWEPYPRKIGYRQYSHGICERHYHEYERQVDTYIAKQPDKTIADSTIALN